MTTTSYISCGVAIEHAPFGRGCPLRTLCPSSDPGTSSRSAAARCSHHGRRYEPHRGTDVRPALYARKGPRPYCPPAEPMIEFSSGTNRFCDSSEAGTGLDMVIPALHVTVLVGSSGSGKTTILRMINRMVDPTSGSVEIDGVDIRDRDPVQLRRGIGYVMQSAGLLPHRTVLDNVTTVLRLTKTPRAQARERGLQLMDTVGLDRALAGRYPRQLSGGQQQRVEIGRAPCRER